MSTQKISDTPSSLSSPEAKAVKQKGPEEEQGSRCEHCALQSRYRKGNLETIATKEYRAADFDENNAYALVSTQKFDKKGVFKETILRFNSRPLLRVFDKVVKKHPDAPAGFKSSFEISSPFIFLYHNWDQLAAYSKTTEDDVERMHLALLLEFMEAEMGKQRRDLRSKTDNDAIEFGILWTIFKPGQLILKSENGYPALMRLEKTVYEESAKTGRRFEVHCTHTMNHGTGLQRRSHQVFIYEKKNFGGGTPCKITALPIYPFEFEKTDESFLKRLERRGRQAEALSGVLVRRYDGQAEYQQLPPKLWFDPDPASFATLWRKCKETGRVVLDGKTYLEDYPYEARLMMHGWPTEYAEWAKQEFGSMEVANLVLCAPYVFGFSMQRKDWCKFYVDRIESIRWKDNAVESLILSSNQKKLLEALVTSHEYPENPRETAEQKGKGLVILLHGTPGSGKTLTAEVTAETARTALLPISLGELYEGQTFDESRLRNLLQYATTWKAVVLIDEADVVLEARTSGTATSSERNALVAVFLKYLEYFSGIIFLTSNRVEDFDSAMTSRIHLALQYSPPASELRRQIWMAQLSALPAGEVDFDIVAEVPGLLKHSMNGREISNTLNTAQTLARHAKAKLGMSHIHTVIDVWEEFHISIDKLKRQRSFKGRQDSLAGPPTGVTQGMVNGHASQTVTWQDPE